MTARELRLRQRIDQLGNRIDDVTDELDQARADLKTALREGQLTHPHGCVYCGHGPARGRPRTCHGHQDLPHLDPHYRKSAPPANTRSKTPAHDALKAAYGGAPRPLPIAATRGNVAA